MKTPPHRAPLLAVALLLAANAAADRVVWSDGETWSGTVRASANGDVRLHDGSRLVTLRLEELSSFAWHPATQRLERAWRFIEAGQTAKELTGEPYPTMELACTLTRRDGRTLAGHLLTTVLYLEQGATTRKIVVREKLRGEPGQDWTDLRYPERLLLDGPAAARRLCRATLAGAWQDPEPALVMCLPDTAALPLRREGAGGFVADAEGSGPVWAVRDGGRIDVGWPAGAGTGLTARVASALRDARDFFDGRTLLGVRTHADPETVCSLLLLSREAHTTLGGARTQPWRLEVWRWRLAADGQNQLAARAVLHRGIRGNGEPLPEVVLHPAWVTEGDAPLELRR